MSEIKSESISSLVDGYSPSSDDSISAHLIDNMIKDDELSSTWKNYHLIGDVLRDEVPQTLQLDLSDSIAEAIAQEATILSPKVSSQALAQEPVENDNFTADTNEIANETLTANATITANETSPTTSNVVNASSRFKAKMAKLVKPFGQVAIAASAAGLMIVGVQYNVADNSVMPNQVVQTVPLSGYANPVSFSVSAPQLEQKYINQQQAQQAVNEKRAAERAAQQRRLHSLLKDHHQQVKLSTP